MSVEGPTIATDVHQVKEPSFNLSFPVHESIRDAIDVTLKELREILHRRGRLSSRNQALDEVCKLLFAHLMSIKEEGEV